MPTYRGFSSVDTHKTASSSLTDVELIKRDLLHHFHTKVGERVMLPTFGCTLWDFLMEHDVVREDIVNEAVRVVQCDPRVKLLDINVLTYEHGIRVELVLEVLFLGVIENMKIDFDERTAKSFGG